MSDADQPPAAAPPHSASARPTAWAEQGIGGRHQHRLVYWLIRLLGKRPAYHASYVASLWYVLFYPSIRRRCRFYLDRRFPTHRGRLRRFRDTYRLVRTYGTTLVDMMALGILGPSSLVPASPNRERLRAIAGGADGFVMLHAHIGCWQVSMSSMGEFSKKLVLLMIPEERTLAMFDHHLASVIDPRTGLEGVMQTTDALLHGQAVAIMGDRTFGDQQNVATVRFLGSPLQLPMTPYRLASATGLPVVVITAPKTGIRSFELRLAKVIQVPPGLGRNPQDYAPYAQQFADILEQFVGEFPWQFFNFYDIWNDAPAP